MKSKMIIAASALACVTLFGSALSAVAAPGETSRADLERAVVQKWSGHVDKVYPMGADAWSVEMAPALAGATVEELQAAASAKSFDDMNKLLLGGTIGDGTQALGDAAADLVFVPVTPCRIFDTRLAGGPIATNTSRGFDVTVVTSFVSQGGEANNCGVGGAGSFAAAQINLTVVAPVGAGYITAYPFLAPQPLAATVNFVAGAIVGNEVAVKLDQGGATNEMSIYASQSTHVVGDIVGYFITPEATALQCEEVESAPFSIAGGSSGSTQSPACPTGYSIVGGGCSSSSFGGRMVTSRTQPTYHFCAWSNTGGAPANFVSRANCCRVPGR